MRTDFGQIDYIIFAVYAIGIIALGLWMSRTKKGHERTSQDYFLAGRSLPWWAIGATCIAANISAEQLIGMTGSGFVMGIAMASYEFASAFILIFIGKYFLPIYIKNNISTMPQFLELRYNRNVRSGLAFYLLLIYIFVNLTSILYLGAFAIEAIMGLKFEYALIGLALFAAIYSIYGGLGAVAWTDIIQVGILLIGGFLTTYIALDLISAGDGVIAGAKKLFEVAPEKFHMIFSKGHENYQTLPGLGVIIGVLFVANTFYWGFNQYTIQRALAGKSIRAAQHGVMFAGYLKLIMPILVVVPGIAAFVMLSDPEILAKIGSINPAEVPSIEHADRAYTWLLGLLPQGIKGLAFAALIAAIVASLASKINSAATIFTVDIYKPFLNKDATEKRMVFVGRLAATISLILGLIVAPSLRSLSQAFQYIQEFTGFVSPGIVAIFLLGMFWKRTTTKAAIWMAFVTLPISLIFYFLIPEIPFLIRMGYSCFIIMGTGIFVSMLSKQKVDIKAIPLEKGIFNTSLIFKIASILIFILLAIFYWIFW